MFQSTPVLVIGLLCLSFNNCKMGVDDSSYHTGLSPRLREAVRVSTQKMLIVVFVVINNEEEAVILNEGCTSESPGALLQTHMLNLARYTESDYRF